MAEMVTFVVHKTFFLGKHVCKEVHVFDSITFLKCQSLNILKSRNTIIKHLMVNTRSHKFHCFHVKKI